MIPRLASIVQDTVELTAKAAEILFRKLGGDPSEVHDFVPFTIRDGETVAPPLNAG
jgi:DNA-binding LacI/PurR family transcriptional regulator